MRFQFQSFHMFSYISLCSVSFLKMTVSVIHFVRMVYFLRVTNMYYMFFPFFLWEGLFHLAEGFESQTTFWMPDSLVWTLKAVADTSSALHYVRKTMTDMWVTWSSCTVTPCLWNGITKKTILWINTHRSRSQLKIRPICWTAAGECWLSHCRGKLQRQIHVLVVPSVIKWSSCLLCWGKCKSTHIILIYIYKICAYCFKHMQWLCNDKRDLPQKG